MPGLILFVAFMIAVVFVAAYIAWGWQALIIGVLMFVAVHYATK